MLPEPDLLQMAGCQSFWSQYQIQHIPNFVTMPCPRVYDFHWWTRQREHPKTVEWCL